MKIIINADDFGMTKSINNAITELMHLGTITSTTVMVNMPYANEAIELLKIPNISIGLHFNLTEGKPTSSIDEVSSLVDKKGNFHSKKELESRAKKNLIKKEEVLLELKNQYAKLYDILGDNITHFDSHQGLNRIPVVFKALLDFGKETQKPKGIRFYVKHYIQNSGKVIVPSLFDIQKFGIKRLLVEQYLKNNKNQINKYFKSPEGMLVTSSHNAIDVFKALVKNPLAKFENAILEIPCHPSIDTIELENTKLTDERVIEYQFLKSTAFLEAKKSLDLVSFNSVVA